MEKADIIDFEGLEAVPVEFRCGCDEARAMRATMALGESELRDMVQKGETTEVLCHFCGKRHYLPPEMLQAMLNGDV